MPERRWLLVVFTLYGVLAFAYSLLMPTWEAPDETAHYLVIWHLNRDDEFPAYEQTYEAIQPPAYYWLASWVFRGLEQIDPSLTRPYRPPVSSQVGGVRYLWTAENYRFLWATQILRWLNIPIGGLALWFIYQAARQIFPIPSTIPLATITFIGCTPQFLHNSAAVSNDPLANLGGAFLFWLLLKTFEGSKNFKSLVILTAVSLLLPFTIKLTILPVSLMTITAVLGHLYTQWPFARRWLVGGSMIGGTVAVMGIALLATRPDTQLLWRTTWWRISTIRPDFFTNPHWPLWRMVSAYVTSYWGRMGWDAVSLAPWMLTLLTALAGMGWLTSLRLLWPHLSTRKFWGWLTAVLLPVGLLWFAASRFNPWWDIPWLVALCAILVWIITFLIHQKVFRPSGDKPSSHSGFKLQHGWLVWGTAVLTLLIIAKNTLTTPQYQGRFFFAALGPMSLWMVTGWYLLWPRKTAVYLPLVILVGMISFNLWLWFYQIIPTYYQPFWD